MGPRKMAKTASCDKAVAASLVGQCLLGQDSVMQEALTTDGNTSIGDSRACPQLGKPPALHKIAVRLESEPQTCGPGSLQLRGEAAQQLQPDVQPYNNVWLVVPTSVAENFAVSSQTVDLGTGSEGSFGERPQSPSPIAVVQSPMLKDEPMTQQSPGQQASVAGKLGLQLHDQQQEPAAVEASAAVVDAAGHMQIMCLDEWYKERMEELRASHAQDLEKMKTMIDELQTRITELEGNLTAMGSMAEGAHMCFNALLQAVQTSAVPSIPLLKLLAIASQQQQASECGVPGSSNAAREPSTPPNSG